MFNTVFCHQKTKVIDIESGPHWIYTHTTLFSSLELGYSIFVGKIDAEDQNPVHKKGQVNIPALLDRIHSLKNLEDNGGNHRINFCICSYS